LRIAQRFIAGIGIGSTNQYAKRTAEKGSETMPHSYVSNLIHYIFSTKERYPFIDPELQSRLWPYMGGIARENRMKALAVGGTNDHDHALLSLPATMSVAKAVQLIKGGSSKWVHDQLPKYRKFGWQDGYGAFSVSASQMKSVIRYINGQKEHHRKKTFEEEFLEFLDKYGVDYDRRYVFR
jgi:REP element-mobilizing transposase RayT